MGSSEVVDSKRFPVAQKSNFSQTCNLLSQYLKEKGNFGDLSLGISRNFESNNGAPAKTMNLLPMIENTGKNSEAPPAARTPNMPPVNIFGAAFPSSQEAHIKTDISVVMSEPETAPMTIFYNGQVVVFNDFPADRAKEIMLLASNGTSQNAINTFATTPNVVPKQAESTTTNLVTTFASTSVQESAQRYLQPNVNDLPIARKASLTRFLEKRKDRITARAPYPVGAAASTSSKAAESKTWLGFAPQFPLQMDRHL